MQRKAPPTPVTVKTVRASIIEGRKLEINWDFEIAKGLRSRSSVRWSSDEGKTWNGLTVGLMGRKAILEVNHLPGGKLIFEVMVNDGFDTASGVSAPVQLPHRPPTAVILSPTEDLSFQDGGILRLWAAALDETSQPLPEESCSWLFDGKVIASGTDIFTEVSGVGKHEIVFRATDRYETTEVIRTLTIE